MKKVFVTGGHGFIAGHVIEELQKRGIEVVTNVRTVSAITEEYLKNSTVYCIDNRDEAGIRKIVEQVDGVINLAGILGTTIKSLYDLDVFYDNNVKGSHSVIKACFAFHTPLVQIAVGNYFENNFYSNTKTAVEKDVLALARYMGLNANVVRGLNVYGPRQKVKNTGKIVPTFITKALNNEPITVYGGKENCGIMDMIYVEDIAQILVDVLEGTSERNRGRLFEAGTGTAFSVYDLAKLIVKLTNSDSVIDEVPMRPGESERSRVVADNPYPFSYTPLESGMLRTIAYYK